MPVSWLVEEKYHGEAILVVTVRVLRAQRCANRDCSWFWEGGARNKRIASRKVAEGKCCQFYGWWKRKYCGGAILVGTAKVLWAQCCANGDCCRIWEGGERNKVIHCITEGRSSQFHGWWGSHVGEQSLLSQYESCGFNAVPNEITPGSEREERVIRGLHQRRLQRAMGPVPWLVEEKVLWGNNLGLAQHGSYGLSAVPIEIAAASEGRGRGIRGLHYGRLRKSEIPSVMAGIREVGGGGNLCCHSTSPVGSALCQWRLLPVLRGRREE